MEHDFIVEPNGCIDYERDRFRFYFLGHRNRISPGACTYMANQTKFIQAISALFLTWLKLAGTGRRWFRLGASRGRREVGRPDVFLGPHEQGIGGIGPTTQRRGGPPYALMVPMLHGPGGRTKSPPRPLQPSCCEHCASPYLRTCTQEEGGHRDRRTASTPAMAAAAAKNIAKKSASYAHANPRLSKDTSAIMVSSRTLASNPCPPLFREHTLALSRMSISRRQIKVIADEVRSFLPYLGQTRNDAPSAL